MFIVRGKSQSGLWESIILDEKNTGDALASARRYFIEISVIKYITPHNAGQKDLKLTVFL